MLSRLKVFTEGGSMRDAKDRILDFFFSIGIAARARQMPLHWHASQPLSISSWNRRLLVWPGGPWTSCIAQADLQLAIPLPWPLKYSDYIGVWCCWVLLKGVEKIKTAPDMSVCWSPMPQSGRQTKTEGPLIRTLPAFVMFSRYVKMFSFQIFFFLSWWIHFSYEIEH